MIQMKSNGLLIEKTNELMMKQIVQKRDLSIHVDIGGVHFNNALILDEFELTENQLTVSSGWFELQIESVLTIIQQQLDYVTLIFEQGVVNFIFT